MEGESLPHLEAMIMFMADIILHAPNHDKEVYTSRLYWKQYPDQMIHDMHRALSVVLAKYMPENTTMCREVTPELSQFIITDTAAINKRILKGLTQKDKL
jgi:hypothetical protein